MSRTEAETYLAGSEVRAVNVVLNRRRRIEDRTVQRHSPAVLELMLRHVRRNVGACVVNICVVTTLFIFLHSRFELQILYTHGVQND